MTAERNIPQNAKAAVRQMQKKYGKGPEGKTCGGCCNCHRTSPDDTGKHCICYSDTLDWDGGLCTCGLYNRAFLGIRPKLAPLEQFFVPGAAPVYGEQLVMAL